MTCIYYDFDIYLKNPLEFRFNVRPTFHFKSISTFTKTISQLVASLLAKCPVPLLSPPVFASQVFGESKRTGHLTNKVH